MSITSAASSMSQAQSVREPTSQDTSENVPRSIDQTDQNLLQFESHEMNANTNKNSSSIATNDQPYNSNQDDKDKNINVSSRRLSGLKLRSSIRNALPSVPHTLQPQHNRHWDGYFDLNHQAPQILTRKTLGSLWYTMRHDQAQDSGQFPASSVHKRKKSQASEAKSSTDPRNVNFQTMKSMNSAKEYDSESAIETESSKPMSMFHFSRMQMPGMGIGRKYKYGEPRGRLLDRDNAFHQASGNMMVNHFAKGETRSQILALYSDDWFHVLLSLQTWKIVLFLTVLVTSILIFFAAIYISVDRSGDACKLGPLVEDATGIISPEKVSFQAAFAFSLITSAQTGYGFIGRPDPFFFTCPYFVVVVYFQIILSLLLNAFVVGVILQRVGRANTRAHQVVFSNKAVIRNINNKFYFSVQVFDLDRKHPVVEAHIRMYAVFHPKSSLKLKKGKIFGTPDHGEPSESDEKDKTPETKNETPEEQNVSSDSGGIGLGRVLPKLLSKRAFENVKAKLETEAIKLFDADFRSNVGSDATEMPKIQIPNVTITPVSEEKKKSLASTDGDPPAKHTLNDSGELEELNSDGSSIDSEDTSIAFENTSYHTPYYQTKVMRIQSPNDDLGGVLFLSIPCIVIHQIDSYSPLCPPQFLGAKLGSKQNPESSINYLFDTETDRNGRLFHPFPGLVLREEDCAAGDRSYCYCPVCGEDFNTKKHLFRHIRYSQYIERVELNEDERDTDTAQASGPKQGVLRHLDLDLTGFEQDAARYQTLIAPANNAGNPFPRSDPNVSQDDVSLQDLFVQPSPLVADNTTASVGSYKSAGGRDKKAGVSAIGKGKGRRGKDKYASVENKREAIKSHLRDKRVEIIVLVEGIEARSSNTFQARHSYTVDDIEFDKFFAPCMEVAPNGHAQVNLNYFHKCIPVPAYVDISGPVQSHT